MEYLFQENLSFWPHLSTEQKNILIENTTLESFSKGEILHSGNKNCLGVIHVKKGQLRTYILSEEGKEITLFRIFPNETCILTASCVLSAITFDVFVDAQENSEVFITNAGAFHKVSEENIYVECYGYKVSTMRFSDVMWAMEQILFMSFDKRLALFLLEEVSKSDSNTIHLTHEQIAKYMGSAREVVSRMLKYFTREGIVTLSRGGITISDKNKLESIL